MRFLKSIYNLIRHPHLPDSRAFWIGTSIGVPVLGIGLSAGLWGWLSDGESASTTIRNIGLILAALTALPVAIWRGIVADKQSAATKEQADVAQEQAHIAQRQIKITQDQVEITQEQVAASQQQARTAQQGLRNERYQKGAEMLGSEVLSVRLGGIYGLQRLAREHPKAYHIAVMQLFCAFVRNPTNDKVYIEKLVRFTGKVDDPWIREDVQAVMTAIGERDSHRMRIESNSGYTLELSGVDLRHLSLLRGNLTNAALLNSDLSDAVLADSNFTNVFFSRPNSSERISADQR